MAWNGSSWTEGYPADLNTARGWQLEVDAGTAEAALNVLETSTPNRHCRDRIMEWNKLD